MVELKNGGKFNRNLGIKFVIKLQDDNPFLKKSCNKVKKIRKFKTLKLQNFISPQQKLKKKKLKIKIWKIWKTIHSNTKMKKTEKPINNTETEQ